MFANMEAFGLLFLRICLSKNSHIHNSSPGAPGVEGVIGGLQKGV